MKKTSLKFIRIILILALVLPSLFLFPQKAQAATTFSGDSGANLGVHFWDDSAGTWTARTFTGDDLFPNNFAAGDKIGFGQNLGEVWAGLLINITAGITADTFTYHWEYYDQASATYRTIVPIVDDTTGFTVVGDNPVKFTYKQLEGMQRHSSSSKIICLVVDSVVNPTEGGAFDGDVDALDGKIHWAVGDGQKTAEDLYNASVAGSWGVVEKITTPNSELNNTYIFYCSFNGYSFKTTNETLIFYYPFRWYETFIQLKYLQSGELDPVLNVGINGSSWQVDKGDKGITQYPLYIYPTTELKFYDSNLLKDNKGNLGTIHYRYAQPDLYYYHSKVGRQVGNELGTGKLEVVGTLFHGFDLQRKKYGGVSGLTVLDQGIFTWDSDYSGFFDSTLNGTIKIHGGTNPFNFIDCEFHNEVYDGSGWGGSGQGQSYESTMYHRNTSLIKAVGKDGNPISGATLTVSGKEAWKASGAGTSAWDDIYVENGTQNGKPAYEGTINGKWLWWNSTLSEWQLTNFKGLGTPGYTGDTGADLPANPWTEVTGDSPAPTLAQQKSATEFTATSDSNGYFGEDSGTATSSTNTTLVDSSKAWTIHQFNAGMVYITSGTGAGQKRGVTDNNANTLTIVKPWDINPDATSKYIVINSIKTDFRYGDGGGHINYNPFTFTISHQDYPTRQFVETVNKKIDWTIPLGNPQDVGSIKVYGTEYASSEPGTIYAQVLYGDGSPANSATTSLTLYKTDGTKVLNSVSMSYIAGSNGIYKYDITAPVDEGVYLADVASTNPTAYGSAEVHVSATANKVALIWDKVQTLAGDVWTYGGRSLDSVTNIATATWSSGSRTLTAFGSLAADVWSAAYAPIRRLTSGQLDSGQLATQSDITSQTESIKGPANKDLTEVESDIAAVQTDVTTINIQLDDVETKIDGLIANWGSYKAKDIIDDLADISDQIKNIPTGGSVSGLDDLYAVSAENLTKTKDISNKLIQLKALVEINRSLIENRPIVKIFYVWGSVILKMVITNPASAEQTIHFKAALPKEIKPEHIIRKDVGLEIEYDPEKEGYFATAEIVLEAGKSVIKQIKVKDIWKISEDEIDSLRKQAKELMEPLRNTPAFAQGATLKNDIDSRLDKISSKQKEEAATPEEHIICYRENMVDLDVVKKDIEDLKDLVAGRSGAGGLLASIGGISTIAAWGIIIILIAGFGALAFILRSRHNIRQL